MTVKTDMIPEDVKAIVAAFAHGEAWARGLQLGDLFQGAAPAAELRGYENEQRGAFIVGALGALPKSVTCDAHGRIIALGE